MYSLKETFAVIKIICSPSLYEKEFPADAQRRLNKNIPTRIRGVFD